MRSLLAFFSLPILLVSACAKDNTHSPNVPAISTPSGDIPGGVGVKHSIKLMPAGSPEVERGEAIAYPKIEGRQPVKVVIGKKDYIDVQNSACVEGVCTIEYTQNALSDLRAPEFIYSIVDESSLSWLPGILKVAGQMPKMQDVKFNPVFKETVSIVVPLMDQSGKYLNFAPKVSHTSVAGGSIKSLSCTEKACTLEYLYEQHQTNPVITLTLESPVYSTKQTLLPQAEVVTLKNSQQTFFASPVALRLVHGVDYESSWKRPANLINVIDAKGMDRPYFQCSADSCVSTFSIRGSNNASMIWSTLGNAQKAQMDFAFANADVQPKAKEIIVDHNVKTLVTLEPGVDYTAAEGALVTALDLETLGWDPSLRIEDVRCDAKGSCSFQATYSSSEEFLTRKYSLKVGSYKSPSQVIKFQPRVTASKDTKEFWEIKDTYNEFVLEAGQDYKTQDGSKAKAIIVSSLSGLSFRDTPSVNDNTRTQIFQCDEQGTCRAWVKNRYSSDVTTLYYAVQTETGTSAEVSRPVKFKRDEIKPLTASRLSRYIGTSADQNLDRVQITLARGVDYSSEFPAQKAKVTVQGKDLTLVDAKVVANGVLEVPCDSEGLCTLQGLFRSDPGYLDIEITLQHDRGESSVIRSRLIREKFATMLPNLSSLQLKSNGTEEFEVTLKPGAGLGYDGDIKARRLQVEASSRNLLNGTPVAGSALVEYPCADDGSCTFRIRGERSNSILKYRLLDDEGHSSYLNTLTLFYPNPFAASTTVSVPAEVNLVTFEVPVTDAYSRTFHLDEQPGVSLVKVEENFNNFEVTLKLDQALTVDQPLVLSYALGLDGKRSNKASLTLKPYQPLSLKPDLVIPAVQESNGTWSITLRYEDHFNPYSNANYARYFFSEKMMLTLDSHPDVLQPTINCLKEKNACTWTFARVEGSTLKEIKARLKFNQGYILPGYHLKEGSLTITF